MKNRKKTALLVIDMQHDFITGSLAVNGAKELIPLINKKIEDFDLVIFTQDFHPANHKSFASNNPGAKAFDEIVLSDGLEQILWPDHCIQGTFGAEIHPDILGNPELKNKDFYIFKKGMDPQWDSYSGFEDNNGTSTGLSEFLKLKGVNAVEICGLATDFCCKLTALDAVKIFKTKVLIDICRPVFSNIKKVIDELKINNVEITQ